jgi:hypothetical protein
MKQTNAYWPGYLAIDSGYRLWRLLLQDDEVVLSVVCCQHSDANEYAGLRDGLIQDARLAVINGHV